MASCSNKWLAMYENLKAYKAEYGDCSVPTTYKKKGQVSSLGRWVSNQRQQKERLSHEQISLLHEIGFVWNVLTYDPWGDMYQKLKEYKQEHGDCLVNTIFPKKGEKPNHLGRWVSRQRAAKASMRKDRKALLDDIGFVWNALNASTKRIASPNKDNDVIFDWPSMYEQLKEYYQEHGDCLVPVYHKPLSTWVSQQRTNIAYLSNEQRGLLIDIGFSWDGSHSLKLFYLNFPPGALGIGLGNQSGSKSMVVIKKIFPECPNADMVQVGDKIVAVGTWPVDGRSRQEIITEVRNNAHRNQVLWFTRTETSRETAEKQMKKVDPLRQPTSI